MSKVAEVAKVPAIKDFDDDSDDEFVTTIRGMGKHELTHQDLEAAHNPVVASYWLHSMGQTADIMRKMNNEEKRRIQTAFAEADIDHNTLNTDYGATYGTIAITATTAMNPVRKRGK